MNYLMAKLQALRATRDRGGSWTLVRTWELVLMLVIAAALGAVVALLVRTILEEVRPT